MMGHAQLAAACLTLLAMLLGVGATSFNGYTDGTLTMAGPQCIKKFYTTIEQNYQGDASCALTIQQAFAAVDKSMCPEGGGAAGSPVQACLNKTAASAQAWTSFISECEVLNVNNRTGSGAAFTKDAKPSCLPEFASTADFAAYAGVPPVPGDAPASAAGAVRTGTLLVLLLAPLLAAAL